MKIESVQNINVAKNQNKITKNDRNVGASFSSLFLSSALNCAVLPPALGILSSVKKSSELSHDKIEILHNTAQKAINELGLADKGVKLQFIERGANEIKLPWFVKLFVPLEQVKDGKNAMFLTKDAIIPVSKEVVYNKHSILLPEKSFAFSAFHEIGHSMNRLLSKSGKMLQDIRMPLIQGVSLIPLFCAFSKTTKPEDGNDLTGAQKTKNFIRNNAGKLTFAAMVPILAEEAMATVKGLKLSSKMLPKELAKHVFKNAKLTYITYLLSAAGVSLASYSAVKIKDHFVDKKIKKAENKA